MDMIEEEWRVVPDFPKYSVSDLGRVRGPRGVLKPHIVTTGYHKVNIHNNVAKLYTGVHALVLRAFVGSAPEAHEAAHLNGNSSDNRLENLRWVTHQENMDHKVIHGTVAKAEKSGRAKLTWEVVNSIRKAFVPYDAENGSKALAQRFGIEETNVYYILRNRTWVDPSYVPAVRAIKKRESLSVAQVMEIRRRCNVLGERRSTVARALGVTSNSVTSALTGWKNLPQEVS